MKRRHVGPWTSKTTSSTVIAKLIVATLLMMALPSPAALAATPIKPVPVEGLIVVPPPQVTATSWILYDATYDLVLTSEKPDARRAMASTTKIVTALVALDEPADGRVVVVSQKAADVGEAEIGLEAGEQIELAALIKAMIIRSGNDAAIAVAESVAGSVPAFVDRMNAKADELGLENTHFINPHGLDAEGHYSSARDLLTLAIEAMDNPVFAGAAWARSYQFPDAPDGASRQAWATNQLLSTYEGTIGVKTGFTFDAGLVFVAAARRDGRTLYSVVMGSDGDGAHFNDSRKLLDYGFDEFGVVPLIVKGEQYGIGRAGEETFPITATATAEAFIHVAAAGLLDPHISLVDGRPVLEIAGEQVEVPIDDAVPELPEMSDAFGWFFGGS